MAKNSIAFLSPTTTYRLMHCLEEQYPEEVELCKAAALFYDTVYVNVQQGPRSDFLGAFADREATKLRDAVSSIFQPLADLSPAPEPQTIREAIDNGQLDENFVRNQIKVMDSDVLGSTPFRDKFNPVEGELNPLLSIEIMMIYGLPEFDTEERAKKLQGALQNSSIACAEDTVSISIPKFDRLSWDDIIEVRSHANWKDLQHLMNSAKSPQELADHVNEAWVALGLAFIEGQEMALYRAASHIPMGPIPVPNPLGVMRDVTGWRRQRQLNAEFPWMHTVALAYGRIKAAL